MTFYTAVNYKCVKLNEIDACMVGRDSFVIPSDVRLDLSERLQAFIMLAIRGLKRNHISFAVRWQQRHNFFIASGLINGIMNKKT